ncbi:MAG TPA: histidine--tRNA ligase [Thermotogae bacterium]|nr:histidine--tRNA ligase [Thermotogota bacterium]
MIKRIKGTEDIYGEDASLWRFVESRFVEMALKYGYQEIRTPILEHAELFVRSVGEETDIVRKEMYIFEDRGGRKIALRPEGTAGIVRAYIEHGMSSLVSPQKFFYMGPMFRYEKPQAGRQRQFHQLGVEIFGTPSPSADAEMIALSFRYLKSLGLSQLSLHINSIGCPKCRPAYREALKNYYSEHLDELCDDCKVRYEKNVLRLLDCKVDTKLADSAPRSLDFLCEECRNHFDQLVNELKAMGIEFVIDHKLVRGLDYYTRTTFEIKHGGLGAQDAVCGGGRYDNLVEELGGRSTPATGFAAGVERIVLAMKAEKLRIPVGMERVFVVGTDSSMRTEVLKVAEELRELGFAAEVDLMERSLSAQMKYAARKNYSYVVILGEEELKSGTLSLKNMETGEQRRVPRGKLKEKIRRNER